MTTAVALLTLITHTQQHVAALESLAAGMTAGLRAGMVDADHLYTLMTAQVRTINGHLTEVIARMEAAELRADVSDDGSPPIYKVPMGGIVGKR